MFQVGWTSIYQLFWGSLGTRVLTHPHLPIFGNLTLSCFPLSCVRAKLPCCRKQGRRMRVWSHSELRLLQTSVQRPPYWCDGRDHLTNCKNSKTHQHHRHRPHQTRGMPQDFRPSARNCADSTMWPFTKLKAWSFHEFSEAPLHFALCRLLQIRISMDIYHQPDGWYITVFTGRCLQSGFSICLANLRASPRLCHDLGS